MKTLAEIKKKYQGKLDSLDLELLIADTIKKSREFVLSYPEYKLDKFKIENLKFKISRRMRGEPLAYILGHKEFYGLDFKVDKNTLIPRPETELLVEQVLQEFQGTITKKQGTNSKQDARNNNPASPAGGQKTLIVDIGTGSGNIIISLAKKLEETRDKRPASNASPARSRYSVSGGRSDAGRQETRFFGVDTSAKAIKIAKQNAKRHKLDKKIKFIRGNLLEPLIKSSQLTVNGSLMILANLPYLSSKIYSSVQVDVKKYEPKSALISGVDGLNHYRKLFQQINNITTACLMSRVSCLIEISPEQKPALQKLIKSYFPKAEFEFKKDLAGKWRLCIMRIFA